LAGRTGDAKFRPIEEILACDIVTLHVPLTKDGPYATHHLVDAVFLDRMKPGAILINTSRGAVVDGADLLSALETGRLRGCVLDVWENEPDIEVNLLECVDIGTPHIAGYSFDGKVNGTMQVYAAACRHLGVEPAFDVAPLLPEPPVPALTVYPDEPDALSLAVRTVYDIVADDAAMREMLSLPAGDRAARFDALRKHYPVRREFFNTRAELAQPEDGLKDRLAGIGFSVTGAP
jgi:erythronate-4-phosphate dehydrogenase